MGTKQLCPFVFVFGDWNGKKLLTYHRPFEDDDLLDIKNLTFKKDNGLLQRKKTVHFGAAKLKCSRSKDTSLKSKALEITFTIDKNVSMAIKRDCDSFLVGVEADDDKDAETLSPLSSEDEEDDDDVYESSDKSDTISSRNECSSDSIEVSSEGSQSTDDSGDESHTESLSSEETDLQLQNSGNGFDSKGEPCQRRESPCLRQNFTDTSDDHLNATFDINAGSKAVKTLREDRNMCHQRSGKSVYYKKEQKETCISTAKYIEPKADNPKAAKPPMLVESIPHKQLVFSPSIQSSGVSSRKASKESSLKNSFSSISSCASNTSISGSLKDLKLVSISSPLKCESLNSSGNSSNKMNTSLSSSFASPTSKSIASSFGDLTLKSHLSPKVAPRNNSTIDKILMSPLSQKSSPKSIKNSLGSETFFSSASTSNEKDNASFKSPTAAVKRRIIPTNVDSREKRKLVPSNLFPQKAVECNGFAYKNISSVQECDLVNETLRSSCSKSICKRSCPDGNFTKVCDSLPSALQKPKSVDEKLLSKQSNSIQLNSYRPRIMYPNANSTEISVVCMPEYTDSLCGLQHLEDSAFTSNCNSGKVTSAILPRTNDARLKEISSIGRHIDSNTFCIDVSFTSTEDDLKAGIKNYDFILQESNAKQKQSACHGKALAHDRHPTLEWSKPYNFEKDSSAQLVKKLTCRCVQTVDVSVLSRSTQTVNDPESTHNFPESENSKSPFYPTLVDCHSQRSNRLCQHGFDESKWRTEEKLKKTISDQHRGLKRKDFSTSDYFTDSSSPRKLISNISEQCSFASDLKSTETKNVKSYNQSTKSVCQQHCHYHTASAPSPVRSSTHLENAQRSLDQNQNFDTESLLKTPIIVDRKKLRKRLALKKKQTICLGQTFLNTSNQESTCVDSNAYSINKSICDDTLTEASIITLENERENYRYAFKKPYRQMYSLESATREFNSDSCMKDESIQTNDGLDGKTFIISERKDCRTPFMSSSSPKRSSYAFNRELYVASNKSEPKSCCCQHSHKKQESPRTPMFPNWYINKFCPKNPLRIDSDASEHAFDEPSLSLESFKEGLKAFRPNRNIMKPPDLPVHSRNPIQNPFSVPDIEFHQKPSKLRKISSSKLSLKKPICLNRKDCHSKEKPLKSSHLPSTIAFSPIRASTPFCEMLTSESSFSNTTLSTIVESPSYKKVERKFNQTLSPDLSDEIDLLH